MSIQPPHLYEQNPAVLQSDGKLLKSVAGGPSWTPSGSTGRHGERLRLQLLFKFAGTQQIHIGGAIMDVITIFGCARADE